MSKASDLSQLINTIVASLAGKAASVHTHVISAISNAGAFGASMLAASDLGTARGLLSISSFGATLAAAADAVAARIALGGSATGISLFTAASADAGRSAVSALGLPVCVFTHRVASGVNSGSSITGSTWGQRPLNTTVKNTLAGASLASNQITLPAGTYYFEYAGEIYGTNGKNRLYNVTDGAEVAFGMNACARLSGVGGVGHVSGEFTLAAPKVLEFQIRCYDSGDRCGSNGATGVDEVYAIAKFWKI